MRHKDRANDASDRGFALHDEGLPTSGLQLVCKNSRVD
jgi:hypothetical protein